MSAPSIPAAQFSAASSGTDNTTQVCVLNQFTNTASIMLVHLSGDGAIEWLYAPSVAANQQTPYLTVNFGSARDYWLCTVWIADDANSPYWATSNDRLTVWKECGVQTGDANKQLVFEVSPTTFVLDLSSACTASVSSYDPNWSHDAVNVQVVNNLANNATLFLYYLDNKLGANVVYGQNNMNLGDTSPVLATGFGTVFGSVELWLIQAVDVDNNLAYVTGGTSLETVQLHDSDANGTVTLSISSTEVSFSKPSGSNSLSLTKQSVSSIQL